jgi:hypothetical protein
MTLSIVFSSERHFCLTKSETEEKQKPTISITINITSLMTMTVNHADDIGPSDVLLGRGGLTNTHIGNKHYRARVAEHQREYLAAKKKDKVLISRRIVAIVKSEGGRFLKKGTGGDTWVEVTDKKAQEKTSQGLREGLDVRNKAFRPKKMPVHGSKPLNIVAGKVVSSPHDASVHSDSSLPDLNEERHHKHQQLLACMYYPAVHPVQKADVTAECAV